jgi:glycosyltransferase 2 family protein
VANTKRFLKVFFFALIGVAILWYITRGQDVERIWEELASARLVWFFLSILVGLISHIIRALRWNLLLKSMNYSPALSTTFYALMTGYLANLAIPRLGEVTRCGTLSRYEKIPFNTLAGSVIAERVFDMICLMVLIFFTIYFQFAFLKGFLSFYVFEPFFRLLDNNAGLLILMGSLSLFGMILLWLYFTRIADDKQSFSGKLKRQLIGLLKGMSSLALVENKFLFITYSILIWFFYFLTVYFCFFALDATSGLGIADGLTVLSLGSLGVLAPVPGGIGAYHFIVIKTLTELFGIQSEPATSYAYLSHASQMILVLSIGALSWFALSAKKTDAHQAPKPI